VEALGFEPTLTASTPTRGAEAFAKLFGVSHCCARGRGVMLSAINCSSSASSFFRAARELPPRIRSIEAGGSAAQVASTSGYRMGGARQARGV